MTTGHRRAVLASALAAVVIVGGAVGVGLRSGGEDRSVDPVAPTVPPGPSRAQVDRVVAECRARMPENLLHGPVQVVTTASSAYSVEALFVAEQDRYWADCSSQLLQEGATPQVTAYDAGVSAGVGFGHVTGPACADRDGCRLFGVAFSDRRDPAVAAVRVELVDGSSETVEAPDGFFAVSVVGVLPESMTYDDQSSTPGFGDLPLLSRVTFLDSSGAPIAATVLDGTGSGEGGAGVPGLPGLDRYPSLMGAL